MPVLIGGDKAHLQRVIGDVVCSFQWVNDEPAMILWPKQRRTLTNGAYVVCLSAAWQYDDDNYLVAKSYEAAKFLGFDDSKFAAMRIAQIIIEGLPDLIGMPPSKPTDEDKLKEVVGEMLLKVDGETIRHEEVTMPDIASMQA